MNEDRLIGWLRRRAGSRLIGDDAAIISGSGSWVVTMDTQISGVHFPPDLDPARIATRLLAVNLSDLAAMGAEPAYGFLALAAPAGFDHRRFFEALLRGCRRHGLELAGGDLAGSPITTAAMTLLGRPAGGRLLTRGGARPGDVLWLGGPVGEAAAGCRLVGRGARLVGRRVRLPPGFEASGIVERAARRAVRRHLSPTPQLALGRWLSDRPSGAAIDVSDGLARDLHRLCAASDVGAELDLEKVPVPASLGSLAADLHCKWQDLVLAGGEDYVLLFTLPNQLEPPSDLRCTAVGTILRDRQVYVRYGGRRAVLGARGWDHLQTAPQSKKKAP
jgi:thiamine-monophosphate kinase